MNLIKIMIMPTCELKRRILLPLSDDAPIEGATNKFPGYTYWLLCSTAEG